MVHTRNVQLQKPLAYRMINTWTRIIIFLKRWRFYGSCNAVTL